MKRTAMHRNWVTAGWVIALAGLAAPFAVSGCELIVNFDRSRIPQGDASVFDGGGVVDSAGQAEGSSEAATGDDGGDASTDSAGTSDAPTDARGDAGGGVDAD